MTTLTTTLPSFTYEPTRKLPVTPRGRALYTIDWFVNGQPATRDHDSLKTTIEKLAANNKVEHC